MIKAWQCNERNLNLMWATELEICRERRLVLPKRAKTKRVCVNTHKPCDAVEVVITPLADNLKVQAVLAAAEETMEFALQVLRKLDIEDWRYDKIDEALTQIREVTK